MAVTNRRETSRARRKMRVRKKVVGTAERPRLCVFKSNKHMYAQVIDDDLGTTLAAASTLSPELRNDLASLDKTDAAKRVGKLLAERALARDVKRVVFDRNGFIYKGRICAIADAARESGLEF